MTKLLAMTLMVASSATAANQGTAFTYQGQLKQGGSPVNGGVDLQFRLFDAAAGGAQIGSTLAADAVVVVDGVFVTSLDFGALAFNGDERWIEIAVRSPAGSANPFVTLSPRQKITSAPYAAFALNVANPSPFSFNAANAVFTGGNVGIGTSAPSQPLHVADNLFATMLLDRVGGAQLSASAQGSTASVGTANNFPFRILTNNSVRMSFDTSGNVGIGTTTPDGKFDVRQSAAADILNLYDGGVNVVTVIDGGNVGLGATAPSQRLHVAGNVAVSGWVGTDAIDPFELFVNNQRAMRFEAASTSPPAGFGPMPNVIGGYAGNEVRPREVDLTPLVGGAFIGGGGFSGSENRVTDHFGVVAGGAGNMAGLDEPSPGDSPYATVGGGFENRAHSDSSTVAGGRNNTALSNRSFVGGGEANIAEGQWSAIAGGIANSTNNFYAFVGGGQGNIANGLWSSTLGGQFNSATGQNATVLGGVNSTAGGSYSLAAGRRAKANHSGAFVWGDSTNADFASTASNQFLIRAAGGVGVNTNSPAADLHVVGDAIFTGGAVVGSGASAMSIAPGSIDAAANLALAVGSDFLVDANSDIDFDAVSGITFTGNTISLDSNGSMSIDAGTSMSIQATTSLGISANAVSITGMQSLGIGGSAGGFLLGVNGSAAKPGGGMWTALSDARLKTDIAPLHESLDRLLCLRGVTFRYRDPTMPLCDDRPHTGFIAQEVETVFPQWVAENADGYKTLSISGFEALTVEALREIRAEHGRALAERDAEIEALRGDVAELRAMVERLAAERAAGR